MDFFNNKENNILKFKINSEGIDINKIEPRLILTTNENKNYFLIGKVENDICKFNIPELSIYENGDSGRIKFEIISEDMYFPVWQDEFEIKTKKDLTLEKMIFDIQQDTKPKAKISLIAPEIEKTTVETPKIEEQVKMMNNDKKNFIESIFENKEQEIKKPTKEHKTISNKNIEEDNNIVKDIEKIKKFGSF